jgi:hypothetical protein
MSTHPEQSSLDPDEPQTPIWFTFLGIALFLFGGIFLLATEDDEQIAPAVAVEAGENAEEPAPEAPEAPEAAQPEAADPHAGHGH